MEQLILSEDSLFYINGKGIGGKMKISECLNKYMPDVCYKVIRECEVSSLGFISCKKEGLCAFAGDKKFVSHLPQNIVMLFATEDVLPYIDEKTGVIVVDNPQHVFWALHEALRDDMLYVRPKHETEIAPTANVSPMAYIAPNNVVIEEGVIIEPFVSIYENTVIKKNSIIRSGSRIGGIGFQENKEGKNISTISHFGGVVIRENVDIQNNSCVDKALFPWEDTIIGKNTKIDNLVHIAHAVNVGEACMFAANTIIAGRCQIGDEVWLGLGTTIKNGVTIGNRARVNIGSVVVEDVSEETCVSGNYAILHEKFLFHQLKMRR